MSFQHFIKSIEHYLRNHQMARLSDCTTFVDFGDLLSSSFARILSDILNQSILFKEITSTFVSGLL